MGATGRGIWNIEYRRDISLDERLEAVFYERSLPPGWFATVTPCIGNL
jgi:hypothetical protein